MARPRRIAIIQIRFLQLKLVVSKDTKSGGCDRPKGAAFGDYLLKPKVIKFIRYNVLVYQDEF